MSRLIITITFFISLAYAQTSKIVWMNYPATGCITCHKIASVKMSDTLYIFGTFHYTDRMNPFLIAFDSSLNVKWYRAFSHSLSNLAIDKMVKIDNNLIAISGGHTRAVAQCPNRNCTFFGIFNIKTQDFVWAKYRQTGPFGSQLSATAIDFDGNNLVIGAQSMGGSWLLKVDLNGNILWQKTIYVQDDDVAVPDPDFRVMDVAFDGVNYVYLFRNIFGENPTLVKFDLNGNLMWAKKYDFSALDFAYKLLKDIDGYVIVGFRCPTSCDALDNDNIIVFKTDFNGNIIWSKLYSSSVAGWSSEDRAYNIALDYDGNYLVSGFIRADSNSSYPIVLKINRTNGNLIWSRIWDTPPNNSSNQAKGVISIGQGKFYLLTFIGSGVDASGGFAIIREDTTGGESSCTKIINSISVSHITPSVSNLTVNINNPSYSLNNLSLTPYSPSINQTNSCQITPISNYEFYKSCSFEIRANKGYIDIKLRGRNNVIVYDIIGNVVYSEFFEGERRIRVKDGIYIIKVGNERVKMVVR